MRYSRSSYQSTTGTKIARLTNIDEKFVKIDTPYNAKFISDFKSSISSSLRAYVQDGKYWLVSYAQLSFLVSLCKKYFDDVLLYGFPESVITADNCFATLYLTQTAPIEVIRAVYRALAKKYHPDLCEKGDSEAMTNINAAYGKCLEIAEKRRVEL